MHKDDSEKTNQLDQATSQRLRRLAERPVNTAAMEQQLEPHWGEHGACEMHRAWWQRYRSSLAAAASLAMLILIGWMIFNSSPPAMAEPSEVSRLHHKMLTSHLDVEPVGDIDAANRVIAEQWADAPRLPAVSLPARGCCLHELAGRRVAVVQLHHNGAIITMAVARAGDLTLPAGNIIERGNRQIVVQHYDGVTMIMMRDDDRWLCIAGNLSEQELLAVIDQVKF